MYFVLIPGDNDANSAAKNGKPKEGVKKKVKKAD